MITLHAGCLLRPMTDADLPEVVAIEDATQPTPWSAQVFRDCFSSHYDCRVVERDHAVIGFVVLSSVLDEAHLLNIAVAPAMQRRGIAWGVLKEIIPEYRDRALRYLYLEVRESNVGAQALYQHLGFQTVGQRKHYYRTPVGRENAVLMMLDLSLL